MILETVTIMTKGGPVAINKADFNEDEHKLATKKDIAAAKKAAAKEAAVTDTVTATTSTKAKTK